MGRVCQKLILQLVCHLGIFPSLAQLLSTASGEANDELKALHASLEHYLRETARWYGAKAQDDPLLAGIAEQFADVHQQVFSIGR